MSTIKPLDIYIGQTKVFPDVNLDILGSPIAGSNMFVDLNESANFIINKHWANISNNNDIYGKDVIVPVLDDSDSSAFHTNPNPYDNYWNFNYDDHQTKIMEIMFDLDAKWMYNQIAMGDGKTFWMFGGDTIQFKAGSKLAPRTFKFNEYVPSKENQIAVTNNFCACMFGYSPKLTTVRNLDLTEPTYFDTTEDIYDHMIYEPITYRQPDSYTLLRSYEAMFTYCGELTTLDITWPTYLYGEQFYQMFGYCQKLPENQVPVLKLRPTNLTIHGTLHDYININQLFAYCHNITSLHIDSDTWQYVTECQDAWTNTGLKQIDIPATATKLYNICMPLGDLWPTWDETQHRDDYSAYKYIIRTTNPMTALLNGGGDRNHCMLFNYWDYDGNQDFIDTFGGIYVPDAQLQDWKDYITDFSAPNIAANCVHGLSDL